jgi:hypothetical protein
MKTVILLSIFLFSYQLQAACKCNCDRTDRSICASSYDLDHPCGGICPSQTPGITPMITACPLTQFSNPITGIKIWRTICIE